MAAYVAVAPEDRQARAIYGALALELGQGTTAVQVFEELVRDNPQDSEALLALADCYLRLELYSSARLGYERLLASNPDNETLRERLELIKIRTAE